MRTATDYEQIFKMRIMENYLKNEPVSLIGWRNLLLQEDGHCQKEIERAYANVKRELLGVEEER